MTRHGLSVEDRADLSDHLFPLSLRNEKRSLLPPEPFLISSEFMVAEKKCFLNPGTQKNHGRAVFHSSSSGLSRLL